MVARSRLPLPTSRTSSNMTACMGVGTGRAHAKRVRWNRNPRADPPQIDRRHRVRCEPADSGCRGQRVHGRCTNEAIRTNSRGYRRPLGLCRHRRRCSPVAFCRPSLAARPAQGQRTHRRVVQTGCAVERATHVVRHDPEKFEEFTRRYHEELRNPERVQALDHLYELAARASLTLLSASKAIDISQATVLAAMIGHRSHRRR